MTALIVYPLICAALFYLGSRAVITSWLWSRYPPGFARFADCAACTGLWLAAGCAIVGGTWYDLDFLGLAGDHPTTWIIVALCGMIWTPMVAALHQAALDHLGSAVAVESDDDTTAL